jgi:hypothetical protein
MRFGEFDKIRVQLLAVLILCQGTVNINGITIHPEPVDELVGLS